MKKLAAAVLAFVLSASVALAGVTYGYSAGPVTVDSTSWFDLVTVTDPNVGTCAETLVIRPYNIGGQFKLRRLDDGVQSYITEFTDGSTFNLGTSTPLIFTVPLASGCNGSVVKWQAAMVSGGTSMKIRDIVLMFVN